MHVLYLIDSLVPGGAETSLAALAPHYAGRGIRLDVAYLHERPGVHDALREAGAELFCLAGRGGRLGWVVRAAALFRRRRPDLIHTTLFEADVAGRLASLGSRTPVVSSLVNPQYGPEQFADPRLKNWKIHCARAVDSVTGRRVARWHALTAYVAGLMSSRLGVPRDLIDIVPRGRDPKSLGRRTPGRRRAARESLGLGDEDSLVVAAARQEHQKGLDVLLNAFERVLREHRSASLVIAGREGNQSSELRALSDRLGLGARVRWLGVRSDVPDLLCAADVFVAPSRWEGLGSVLLEAMALEAPIVASDLPAIREVVGPDHALLAPPGDGALLADSILVALGDPALRRSLAESAYQRFMDEFTIERIADEMVAFYGRAVR